MKVACLQTEPKDSIKNALNEALNLSSIAIKEDVNFLFLPEYCGGITSNGKLYIPPSDLEDNHIFLQGIRNLCNQHSIWSLIGSIAIKLENNKIVNRSFVINPQGEIVLIVEAIKKENSLSDTSKKNIRILLKKFSPKEVVDIIRVYTNLDKRELYKYVLMIRQEL